MPRDLWPSISQVSPIYLVLSIAYEFSISDSCRVKLPERWTSRSIFTWLQAKQMENVLARAFDGLVHLAPFIPSSLDVEMIGTSVSLAGKLS